MSQRRVVVTGSSGFIGSRLSKALAGVGHTVIGIDTAPPLPVTVTEWCPVDITVNDLAPALKGAAVVYHLAARPGVRSSWTAVEDYVRINILGTQRVVEACLRAGVPRLVITSSSSVYGAWRGRPARETDAPAPRSPYAVTKLASEQLARAHGLMPHSRLAVVVLRLFTVYGPGQRPDMLISRLLRAALAQQPVALFGAGEQARDFTYVDDVIAALRSAGEADVPGCVLNVGTGTSTSLHSLLDLVAATTDASIPWTAAPHQPGDATCTQADIARAGALLGYRPRVSLAEGLRRQWQFVTASAGPHLAAGHEEDRDAARDRIIG